MRHSHAKRGLLAEINVVPYIDVMLVLLVIFMITAPLLSQGVRVKLPHANAKTLPPTDDIPLVVSVDRRGQYYLNVASRPKLPLSEKKLLYRVAAALQVAREAHHTPQVYVKGDKEVGYGAVVKIMALLQRAGVGNVGLITEPV